MYCTMPKKMLWVPGWRYKHAYHYLLLARKSVSRILVIGAFELYTAHAHAMGFGAVLLIRIPLLTTSQETCFWILV